MHELLNPDKRTPKVTLLDSDIIVDIAPNMNVLDGAKPG